MIKYKICVHFRHTIADEMEQDYEIHEVEAENECQAKRKALEFYKSKSVISFKTEII